MNDYHDLQIYDYIKTGEPMDKAGFVCYPRIRVKILSLITQGISLQS